MTDTDTTTASGVDVSILDLFADNTVAQIEAFIKLEFKAYLKARKAENLQKAIAENKIALKVGDTVKVLSKGVDRIGVVTKLGDKTMFSVQFPDGPVTAKGTIKNSPIRYDKLLEINPQVSAVPADVTDPLADDLSLLDSDEAVNS